MDAAQEVHAVIAGRVRALRTAAGLSLDQLGRRSGVSRSAISLIERAESSPTAVVLDKLAAALGVPLTALLEPVGATGPLCRRAQQPVWVDPASGYRRRTVAGGEDDGAGPGVRLVEISFPPGATVAFDTPAPDRRLEQVVWLLSGSMAITVDGVEHRLQRGDRLRFAVDGPVAFHNPTSRTSRYAVVQHRPGRSW